MNKDSSTKNKIGRISPWPLFIAVGLGLSEVGIVFGVAPLAIGGILLFGGSCAGILHEAGYVASLWRSIQAIGVLFSMLGTSLWFFRLPTYTIQSAYDIVTNDIVAFRGVIILLGGGLLIVAGLLGPVWVAGRSDMFG